MNTHTIAADIRQDMLNAREATGSKNLAVSHIRCLYVAEQTLIAA